MSGIGDYLDRFLGHEDPKIDEVGGEWDHNLVQPSIWPAQADEDLLVCSGLGEVEDVGTLPELRAWGGQQSEVAQPGVGEGNIENNVGAASKCPLHQGLFAAASSSASASSAFCRDPKVKNDDEDDSQPKRNMRHRSRRDLEVELWSRLDLLVPGVGTGLGLGSRAKALWSGRTKVQLLEAAIDRIKILVRPTLDKDAFDHCESLGVLAVSFPTGTILHASKGFKNLLGWGLSSNDGRNDALPSLNLRAFMPPEDACEFQMFVNRLQRLRGKGRQGIRKASAKMVGDKFDFRFLTNAPGTPKWALIRSAPIELTLASIDALSRIETDIDSVAVFFAPLPRITSVNSLVHVSHFRNLISHEIANKEYKMHWDKEGLDPFDMVSMCLFGSSSPTVKPGVFVSVCQRVMNFAGWLFQKATSLTLKQAISIDREDNFHMHSHIEIGIFGGRMFRVVRNIVFGDVRSTLTSQATRSTSGENSSRSMHHMIIEPDTPIANQLFWVQTIIPSSQGGQHKGGQHKRPAIQHWTRISGDEMLAWIDLPWSTGERSNRSAAFGRASAAHVESSQFREIALRMAASTQPPPNLNFEKWSNDDTVVVVS